MKVKLCGIKKQEQLDQLSTLSLDYIGFNFYPASKRFCDQALNTSMLSHISKVGVFVNHSYDNILNLIDCYDLDYVQLHGEESPEFALRLKEHVKVIKVFSITAAFDFSLCEKYSCAELFLFDTYTTQYGGSGKKFNWELINEYSYSIPFFLAGGIGPSDICEIQKIEHPSFYGVDINSQFEVSPGIKDLERVSKFINKINV